MTADLFENDAPESPEEPWRLSLYVAGKTPASQRAARNLRAICERYLAGRYILNVVDLTECPGLAEEMQIVAVPVLIRERPSPERKVLGDLSNLQSVLAGLEIHRPYDEDPPR